MERVRRWMRRIFCLGRRGTWGVVLLGSGLLALVFFQGWKGTLLAYGAYLLSAYSLLVVIANLVQAVQGPWRRLCRVPLVARWRGDDYFRIRLGLVLSFCLNLCYAGFRVGSAVTCASPWDGALGGYYVLLCGVRLYLIRRTPRAQGVTNYRREWAACRWAGCWLLGLNVALVGISLQIVQAGQYQNYPGTLIYAAALYAFYCLGAAICNAVKYRKFQGPVLTAAKGVSLTTALVSMFSLESAMFHQFGGEAAFQAAMTSVTALVVCGLALAIAVLLLAAAHRKRKLWEGGSPS